jgi:hypothetical protein
VAGGESVLAHLPSIAQATSTPAPAQWEPA